MSALANNGTMAKNIVYRPLLLLLESFSSSVNGHISIAELKFVANMCLRLGQNFVRMSINYCKRMSKKKRQLNARQIDGQHLRQKKN